MKILVEKAVIEQALEALEQWKEHDAWHKRNDWNDEDESAITALREALGQLNCQCGDKCFPIFSGDIEYCETCGKQTALVEQAEQEPEVWYCPDCGTLSETQVKCCPDWIRSRKVTKNFAITCKATFDRNGQAEQEPQHSEHYWQHEINNARADGYERGYVAAKKLYAEQAEQEPVAWLYRGELHWENPSEWAKGEVTPLYTDAPQSNTQQEPIARVPLHPEQGLEWFKPPPVWGTLLYAAPVRTKDLTDDEINELWLTHGQGQMMYIHEKFARAVIAADRKLNKQTKENQE